jgi:hypothetical protein
MPISPPDGKPLAAVLSVRSTDGAPLPPGLQFAQCRIFLDGSVWISKPVANSDDVDPAVVRALSRDGPKWEPGANVDVVVTLATGTGTTVRLGASEQPILRTD